MQTRDVRDEEFAVQEIDHQMRDTTNMATLTPGRPPSSPHIRPGGGHCATPARRTLCGRGQDAIMLPRRTLQPAGVLTAKRTPTT
jgi:hypothetical protein